MSPYTNPLQLKTSNAPQHNLTLLNQEPQHETSLFETTKMKSTIGKDDQTRKQPFAKMGRLLLKSILPDRPRNLTAWRPLAKLGKRMFRQPSQQAKPRTELRSRQKKANSDEERQEAHVQNEIALNPLRSVWGLVEQYMDADSVFNMASTCSTAHCLFRETESFTKPSLPHILHHQARAPKIYYEIDPTKPRLGRERKMVQVKHSFLVLLMESPEVDGDYRKVQLHFIFDYPTKQKYAMLLPFVYMPVMSNTRVHIDGYGYNTNKEAWMKVPVEPSTRVTALMKQAITKCHEELLQ
ncbi:expressed unknown protein [Seminavis robusta]|uniref:Uncharacterized protein n=1 Tax=Seminavis robusta TaxID=568900 RepID=A0A9N8EL17_9STRA|nr:expressed unknown protein [Seminavis robusta]|eukprot:Sro1288_g259600.1 n/a (296) ;mRNA; f:19917-20804